jgi:hypothetical protein
LQHKKAVKVKLKGMKKREKGLRERGLASVETKIGGDMDILREEPPEDATHMPPSTPTDQR